MTSERNFSDPPVDIEALSALFDGDPEFERELVAEYRKMGESCIGTILTALAAQDLSTLHQAAHSLKGASANMQAMRTAQLANTLEVAVREGNRPDQLTPLVAELQAELTRTIEFLAARVS